MRGKVVVFMLSWILAACAGHELGLDGELSLRVGPQGELIFSDGTVELLSTTCGFLQAVEFSEKVTMQFGQFRFDRGEQRESPLQFHSGTREGDRLVLSYTNGENKVDITAQVEAGGLLLSFKLNGSASALRLNFNCHQEDHFLGFGEQYAGVDGRGKQLPIWTMENGLGRAPEPVLPWQGPLWASYFPMAYFVNPRGYGLVLDASGYVEFDLCTQMPGVWSWKFGERVNSRFFWQVEILLARSKSLPQETGEREFLHAGLSTLGFLPKVGSRR